MYKKSKYSLNICSDSFACLVRNDRAGITADLADHIGQWLGNGAATWLRMQAAYDLWQVRRRKRRPKIKPLQRAV